MTAATTLVSTTAPVESKQATLVPGDRELALKAMDTVGKLAEASKGDPVRMAIIAAVIVSGLAWGAHEVLGGRAATERETRTNARIDKIEAQQTEIRIQLASIARAVGAEPVR